MRRGPVVILLAVCLAGVAAVLVGGVLRATPRGFTIGVPASYPAVSLKPRQTVCQRPIAVPPGGAFDRIRLVLGTFGRPRGPQIDVTVQGARGPVHARGRGAGGYPDITRVPDHVVALDRRVASGSGLQVCVGNRGSRTVALYGSADGASRTSAAFQGGRSLGVDVAMSFERAPRPELGLARRIIDRASLFRFAEQGAWLYWVLAALSALLVPLLLAIALRAALSARE